MEAQTDYGSNCTYSHAMIGQDMKSLVAAMTSAASLILMEIGECKAGREMGDSIKEYAELICRTGGDMTALIGALMPEGYPLADRLDSKHACDLREEMRKVLLTFSPQAQIKHITLLLHIRDDIPLLSCDFEKFRLHGINNIVAYAMSRTAVGGVVTINAEMLEGGRVAIMVAHSGDGESNKHHESIFYRRGRDHALHDDEGAGHRFGLCNAMRIVRAYGGEIRTMDNPMRGTLFMIELPCQESI